MEHMIRTYSSDGALLLDCSMGSGSTAIAAMNTGRKFIGFELDKAIFEKATQRIREHAKTLAKKTGSLRLVPSPPAPGLRKRTPCLNS